MDDGKNSAMPLDGNAEGGLLRELFSPEMTAAEITCDGCGAVARCRGRRNPRLWHYDGRGVSLRAL